MTLQELIKEDVKDTLNNDHDMTPIEVAYFMELFLEQITKHAMFCLDDNLAIKVQAFKEGKKLMEEELV